MNRTIPSSKTKKPTNNHALRPAIVISTLAICLSLNLVVPSPTTGQTARQFNDMVTGTLRHNQARRDAYYRELRAKCVRDAQKRQRYSIRKKSQAQHAKSLIANSILSESIEFVATDGQSGIGTVISVGVSKAALRVDGKVKTIRLANIDMAARKFLTSFRRATSIPPSKTSRYLKKLEHRRGEFPIVQIQENDVEPVDPFLRAIGDYYMHAILNPSKYRWTTAGAVYKQIKELVQQ